MLKSIKYEVLFPSTGKSFKGEHSFNSGLTSITGPNEAGKSLIIEFARFGFFGVKALRGKSDEYKKLKVEQTFELKGQLYRIDRKLSNATVYRATESDVVQLWEPLAVGTTAVNQKVVELFGYGLAVFDTAHSVNQGEVEALGKMLPAERKRMVDSVIGLTVLDDLIKAAGDEAVVQDRAAQTISEMLVEPGPQPVPPDGYQASEQLTAAVKTLTAENNELNQINGWLSNERTAPTEPEPCPVEETADVLRAHEHERAEAIKANFNLEREKAKLKLPDYTLEQLEKIGEEIRAYDAWIKYKRIIDALPPEPIMPMARVVGQREYLRKYNAAKAAHDRAKYLWAHSRNQCPSCQHEWSHDGHVKPEPFTMEAPDFTADDLDEQERRIKARENLPELVPEALAPTLTLAQLQEQCKLQPNVNRLAEIEEQLYALPDLPDRSQELRLRIEWDAKRKAFDEAFASYCSWRLEQEKKIARREELKGVPEALAQAQARLQAAVLYERDLDQYQWRKQEYDQFVEKLSAARARADDYRKAKEALQLLKAKVKSHLIPSLNVVASRIIDQMTNGQRTKIEVDEDFNILVDGQQLNTLSGSGKAVANLAIRIGLGQVLTNRVFSVFMGDEIDAAMDDDRAGSTAETLRALANKISQVIIVSHKRPEADNYIELGEAA